MNESLRHKTGNNTDELPEYNAKFERVLDILGRKHMNGLTLIPELCSTEQLLSNHMNGLAFIQEIPELYPTGPLPLLNNAGKRISFIYLK